MMFPYVQKTPLSVREGRRLALSHGALAAKASRTVEPLLLDLTDRVVPASGPCRILEVGCGSVVYTSMCRRDDPSFRMMNLWSSMTEGCGPLPVANELEEQLRDAQFTHIKRSFLMPGFVAIEAA